MSLNGGVRPAPQPTMAPDLEAITDATDHDGADRLTSAVRVACDKLPAYEGGDPVAQERIDGLARLVDHLTWLLGGRLAEAQTLRRNIHALCPRELAARIVQD